MKNQQAFKKTLLVKAVKSKVESLLLVLKQIYEKFLWHKARQKEKNKSSPPLCVNISPHKGHLICGGGVSSDVMHLQWKHKFLIFVM